MIDPEQTHVPYKEVYTLSAIAIIGILLAALCIEYYLGYEVVNTTGQVIYKEVSSPVNVNEDPFLIVIKRGENIYQARVPFQVYKDQEIGDIVLLIDEKSGLLKRTLQTRLYDQNIYLKQSDHLYPEKPTNTLKAWSLIAPCFFTFPKPKGGLV